MIRGNKVKCLVSLVAWVTLLWFGMYFSSIVPALSSEFPTALEMPMHWKVVSDFSVPTEQVKAISIKLGANLSSVRNTIYDVIGKRVQINVIVARDSVNAEKLMMKLKSIKAEEALLRKGLVIYEFVGLNDVLSVIAEGREYLDLK
jgi:hypothetical protein